MLKFLKKLFNADVTIAPVVSVNEDNVKTYDTVEQALIDLENDPKITKEKLENIKAALKELKLTKNIKIQNGELITK